MTSRLSRRTVLSGAGVVLVSAAGCVGGGGDGPIDVVADNLLDQRIAFELTIEDFEESGELEPEASRTYEEVLDRPNGETQFQTESSLSVFTNPLGNESVGNESGESEPQRLAGGETAVDMNESVDRIVMEFSRDGITAVPETEDG